MKCEYEIYLVFVDSVKKKEELNKLNHFISNTNINKEYAKDIITDASNIENIPVKATNTLCEVPYRAPVKKGNIPKLKN